MDYIKQLTDLINAEIKKKYKSDRRFAQALGIPATTLSSILKNGVKGTAYSTVMEICMALGIRLVYTDSPIYLDEQSFELLAEYQNLDDEGKQVTRGIVKKEKERIESEKERLALMAYGRERSESTDIKQKIETTSQTVNYIKHN